MEEKVHRLQESVVGDMRSVPDHIWSEESYPIQWVEEYDDKEFFVEINAIDANERVRKLGITISTGWELVLREVHVLLDRDHAVNGHNWPGSPVNHLALVMLLREVVASAKAWGIGYLRGIGLPFKRELPLGESVVYLSLEVAESCEDGAYLKGSIRDRGEAGVVIVDEFFVGEQLS